MKKFHNQQAFSNQIRKCLIVLILCLTGISTSSLGQRRIILSSPTQKTGDGGLAKIQWPITSDGYFCPDELYEYKVIDIPSVKKIFKIEWSFQEYGKDIAHFYTTGGAYVGKSYNDVENVKVKFKNDPYHSPINVIVTVYYDDNDDDKFDLGIDSYDAPSHTSNRRALEKPTISAPIVYCGYTSNITLTAAFSHPLTPSDVDLYEWKIPSGWSGSSTTSWIACTPTANTGGVVQVRARSKCANLGWSDWASLTVTRPTPVLAINGPESIACGSKSPVTYSVANLSGATYTWKIPSGWSGSSTSNTITVTPDGSSVGDVEVTATLTCDGTAVKPSAKKSVSLNSIPSGLTIDNYGAGSRPITCTNSMVFRVIPNDPSWKYKWTWGKGVRVPGSVTSYEAFFVAESTIYGYNGTTWAQVEVTNACGLKIATLRRDDIDYESNPPFAVGYVLCYGCRYSIPAPPELIIDREAELYVASIASGGFNTKYTQYIWDLCDGPWSYSTCYAAALPITNQGSDRIKLKVPYSISGSTMSGRKTLKVTAKNGCGESIAYKQEVVITSSPYLTAYPNPVTTGSLMLEREGSSDSNAWSYTIYDIFGQSVRAGVIEKNQTTIQVDVQGLPKGLYYILAQDGADIHRQYVRVE